MFDIMTDFSGMMVAGFIIGIIFTLPVFIAIGKSLIKKLLGRE